MPPETLAAAAELHRLRAMVARRALSEGRTHSRYPGLRYYRFSAPTEHRKTQRLVPGVVVVLQGRKTVALPDRPLSYDPLHCLVLAGETPCHGMVVEASPEQPYLAVHLDLPPDILVRCLVALAERPAVAAAAPLCENFVATVEPMLLDALSRLLAAADDAGERLLIAPLVVEEIVLRLLRSAAAGAVREAAALSRHAARIQRALQFMRGHFAEALTVDRLASEVAMSPSHFAHSFREVAGISPMRYLRDLRLDHARALMLGSGLRAGEAAALSGFASAAHFAREFKSRFDTSPTEYVRRMRTR